MLKTRLLLEDFFPNYLIRFMSTQKFHKIIIAKFQIDWTVRKGISQTVRKGNTYRSAMDRKNYISKTLSLKCISVFFEDAHLFLSSETNKPNILWCCHTKFSFRKN